LVLFSRHLFPTAAPCPAPFPASTFIFRLPVQPPDLYACAMLRSGRLDRPPPIFTPHPEPRPPLMYTFLLQMSPLLFRNLFWTPPFSYPEPVLRALSFLEPPHPFCSLQATEPSLSVFPSFNPWRLRLVFFSVVGNHFPLSRIDHLSFPSLPPPNFQMSEFPYFFTW